MAKVYVTTAQKDAARMVVEWAKANGEPIAENVIKIANARPDASWARARRAAADRESSKRKAR